MCDSPAPLACVPSKRVLMPTWAYSCPGFGRVRIGHPLTSYRLLTYITRRPSAAPVHQPWVGPPVMGGPVYHNRDKLKRLGELTRLCGKNTSVPPIQHTARAKALVQPQWQVQALVDAEWFGSVVVVKNSQPYHLGNAMPMHPMGILRVVPHSGQSVVVAAHRHQ